MYVAYLLDPVSWVANEEESGYVPDLPKLAAMNTLFGIDMDTAAKEGKIAAGIAFLYLYNHANSCHHTEIASDSVALNAYFVQHVIYRCQCTCLSSMSFDGLYICIKLEPLLLLWQVVYRVAEPELRGKVTIEWTVLFAHGLQDMDLGPELVKTKQIAGQAIGCMEFETDIKKRRCLWSANGPLGSQYPALAPVARGVLSMHATSCV